MKCPYCRKTLANKEIYVILPSSQDEKLIHLKKSASWFSSEKYNCLAGEIGKIYLFDEVWIHFVQGPEGSSLIEFN